MYCLDSGNRQYVYRASGQGVHRLCGCESAGTPVLLDAFSERVPENWTL